MNNVAVPSRSFIFRLKDGEDIGVALMPTSATEMGSYSKRIVIKESDKGHIEFHAIVQEGAPCSTL